MAISIVDSPSPPSERDPLLAHKKHDVTVTTRSLRSDDDDNNSDNASTAPPPLYLHNTSPTRFLVIFAQILLVQFAGCFDATVMASSHPAITSHFRAAAAASWLSTSFLLASTACQPLIGRLSDATGRRPLFLGCLAVFVVATAGCAAAPGIGWLIAARGLCGVGAGGLMVLGDIILSDLVPVERRGLYYPYSSLVYGIGSTLGAALGGFLAEHLGWRWIFASQIPVMLVCLAVSAVVIPPDLGVQVQEDYDGTVTTGRSLRDSLRDFDFVGSGLLCIILTTMILGLNLGGQILPWSHPIVASALVVCAACIPLFLYVEWRCASHPLVPLDFISRAPRANLLASNFISTMLTNSVLFNIRPARHPDPLRPPAHVPLRRDLGRLGPDGLHHRAHAKAALVPRRGRRLLPLAGALCLARLPGRSTPHWLAVAALVPTSVGQGLQNPGTFIAVLASAAEEGGKRQNRQGLATSVMVLVRSVGQVVGIAASSLLLQGSLRHYLGQLVVGGGGGGGGRESRSRSAPVDDEVVKRVLASIESIASLEEPYRTQVVESYEKALRTLFAGLAILALVSLLILCPAKVPRIGGRARNG
ncbi:transporter [Apiospora hydei]|uniref:Transporter n=1 Tax=Apiospora hydei TaxID=1337664 RepID=A0ABR1WG85_9PEZI